MSSLLKALLTEANLTTSEVSKNSRAGKFWQVSGVEEGPELLRIRALPRRRWQESEDLEELRLRMSIWLRKPGSDATLLPMQAVALAEFAELGKLNVIANMGTGKTLLSALLPVVGAKKRPLHITYKSLQDKTIREYRKLAEDWKICQTYEYLSFERFSRPDCADYLDKLSPDFICMDESHAMKGFRSARTQRLGRWIASHPAVTVVPMTGTPGDTSVREIAHISEWVHREGSPLPTAQGELSQWADALDEKVSVRRGPGALSQFSANGSDALDDVRNGVGIRLEETPGNVYYRVAGEVPCSLYLDAEVFNGYSQRLEDEFEFVRKCGDELSNGKVLETPLEKYLLFQTLNLGLTRILEPPPPPEWRAARKAYASFVTEMLDTDELMLDSPGQVSELCASGGLDSFGLYEAWQEIRPSFVMHSVIDWLDLSAMEFVADYMEKHHCLVWTPFPAVGKKLQEMTGRPFFHRHGKCLKFGSIEEYHGKDSAIVSTKSNYLGRNLQDRYSKMLVLGPSGKADILEQLIARVHRTGQKAEGCEISFFCGSVENFESLYQARARASRDKTVGRNQSSKLLTGDWMISTISEAVAAGGARWVK